MPRSPRSPTRNSNPTPDQDALFTVWRYHAVFVISNVELVQAESQHRDRAIIEQLVVDAVASALAHVPSGSFPANAAWAVLRTDTADSL